MISVNVSSRFDQDKTTCQKRLPVWEAAPAGKTMKEKLHGKKKEWSDKSQPYFRQIALEILMEWKDKYDSEFP